MSSFLEILSFSILPLILVLSFALIVPGMGAVLTLRNEIMLALALPSIANAGMAFAMLCGINPGNSAVLYVFATITTLAGALFSTFRKSSARLRELRLAGLFVIGQILTIFFAVLSTDAHVHITHLLNGEVMAAGKRETTIICAASISLLAVMYSVRKTLWLWCADEDFFQAVNIRYRTFKVMVYTVMAAAITVGVATVGALLITALMVLPALLADTGKGGIARYALLVFIIGTAGALCGFLLSIVLDLPPAVCAAGGAGVLGIIFRLAAMLTKKNS